MKKALKIIGIILLILLVIGLLVYFFVLQYPSLKDNPKEGKWYKVTDKDMVSADGSRYKAFFKKGSENKVLVYFAGGGSNINEETAREGWFNSSVIGIDMVSNFTMNMGGLATASDDNPFKDWTVIAFPCATGDFMSGTGEFLYTDTNGKEQTLYHHGYTNYSIVMDKIMELTDIDNPEAVVVTGYSAGGFSAALLADDIFTKYFPNAASKNVMVDASLLIKDDWHNVLTDVWHTPTEISDKITTDNLMLDCFTTLKAKYGDGIHLLFDCSTRDGDLAKTQNYFDNGKMEVDEDVADCFQQILKDTIPKFKEAGAYLFIWDGLQYYDDPRNMTMHTMIATPYCLSKLDNQELSLAEWLMNTVNGELKDYGLDLVNKQY